MFTYHKNTPLHPLQSLEHSSINIYTINTLRTDVPNIETLNNTKDLSKGVVLYVK